MADDYRHNSSGYYPEDADGRASRRSVNRDSQQSGGRNLQQPRAYSGSSSQRGAQQGQQDSSSRSSSNSQRSSSSSRSTGNGQRASSSNRSTTGRQGSSTVRSVARQQSSSNLDSGTGNAFRHSDKYAASAAERHVQEMSGRGRNDEYPRAKYSQYSQRSGNRQRVASNGPARSNNNRPQTVQGAGANQFSRSSSQYARSNYAASVHGKRKSKKGTVLIVLILLVVIAAGGLFLYNFTRPFNIVVNGKTVEVSFNTTYADLHTQGLLTASNGDLVAVDKTILENGAGGQYKVYDNSVQVDNVNSKVSKTSVITEADGDDVMEDYDVTETTTPHTTVVDNGENYDFYDGYITLEVYPGRDGVDKTLTGKVSGKTAKSDDSVTMIPRTYWALNPEIDTKKVVCLTFDDGPSEYTQQILTELEKYNAKATFFEIGLNIEDYPAVTTAVANAGMQLGSHAYAHPGVYYDKYYTDMTPEEVVADLAKNQQLLYNATGQTITCFRAPGGYLDYTSLMAGADYITSAVRWSIDTEDWDEGTTADEIANTAVSQAYSGAIILMHDGGGDPTRTVTALDSILSQLSEQGYSFITVDDLITLEKQKLINSGDLNADGTPATSTAATTTAKTTTSD